MDDDYIRIIESKIEEVKWKLKKEISTLKALIYSLFMVNIAETNVLLFKDTFSFIFLAFSWFWTIAVMLFFLLEDILSKDK